MYITATNNHREVGDLLKEWTGKEYNDNYMLWNSYFVVAREGDDAIGCVQLIVIDDPFWSRRWGLVENVYVKSSHRKRGIAKKMMEFVTQEAFVMGCALVKLTSSNEKMEAHKLYRALGYLEGKSFKCGVHEDD